MQPTPEVLPGKSPWTEEPGGYSSQGYTESDMTEDMTEVTQNAHTHMFILGMGDLVVKNQTAIEEEVGSIPGSGRSIGEGNGNPLQCYCLGNPMDRGACRATVYGVTRARRNLVINQQQSVHFSIICNNQNIETF